MKINKNESNGRIEIRLEHKVINYAYINEADKDGLFRLAVELTEEESQKIKAALSNSDLSAKEKECLDGGQLLNAKTQYEPVRAYTPNVSEDVYSGCIGTVVVAPYRYQYREKGRNYTGIAYGLRAVLKEAEGEHLAQGRTAQDYFGDMQEFSEPF